MASRGAKTPIDKLEASIGKILNEYGDEVTQNIREVVPKVAKAGAQALQASSRGAFGGTGDYAKGWASAATENRMYTTATIYNMLPGLPHLLEYGHAKRGGGRVSGREHIAPVEREIVADFEKEVEASL